MSVRVNQAITQYRHLGANTLRFHEDPRYFPQTRRAAPPRRSRKRPIASQQTDDDTRVVAPPPSPLRNGAAPPPPEVDYGLWQSIPVTDNSDTKGLPSDPSSEPSSEDVECQRQRPRKDDQSGKETSAAADKRVTVQGCREMSARTLRARN
ncbi:hypothetical protein Bbelb_306630 [Branchiostoma belcheri]|nr:hypothetical protein Bbelb_306630 [Branchiostoma belcheri]